MFCEKIRSFSTRISGKLDDELLLGALDYLNYNEEPLAIEILCDHLVEYNVDLSQDDQIFLKKLLSDMEIDISAAPFKYLNF